MVAKTPVDGHRLPPAGRLIAALVAVGAAAPLVLAASLTPAAQGLGTHTALGLPACGWASMSGIPCPSCGMTTAFAEVNRTSSPESQMRPTDHNALVTSAASKLDVMRCAPPS